MVNFEAFKREFLDLIADTLSFCELLFSFPALYPCFPRFLFCVLPSTLYYCVTLYCLHAYSICSLRDLQVTCYLAMAM